MGAALIPVDRGDVSRAGGDYGFFCQVVPCGVSRSS